MDESNLEEEIPNPYTTLNIPVDASAADIKNAYKRWCILLHPDKHAYSSLNFQRVQLAYELLMDEALRREFDSGTMVKHSLRSTMPGSQLQTDSVTHCLALIG